MHKELEVMKPRCKGLWERCRVAAIVFVLPAAYQHTDPGVGGGKGKECCDGHRCQGSDRWN